MHSPLCSQAEPEVSCATVSFQNVQHAAFAFGYVYLSLPVVLTWALASYPKFGWLRTSLAFLMKAYNEKKAKELHHIIFGWEFLVLLRKVLLMVRR